MDRRELEIMLNEAFDRGIVSVGHLVHETVEVGFLNELGRTVGFTLNGWKEAIETIPVDLFDSFDDGRGRERFLSDCKALGGKVPQNTYRGELVSALADVLMVEEAAPALGALESALDSARRKGYCVFDRGVHGDVPADGLVYLCSTYPAAVGLKDSLDSVRAQGNGPDTAPLAYTAWWTATASWAAWIACRRLMHMPSTPISPRAGASATPPSASPT